ncbi:MAG TPA: amidase family protein [Steroidobacteraceae bacterium]|nr:amidase family protein [Steroidobacteraceae bacterium]
MQALADDAFNPGNATIAQLRLALDAGKVNSEQLVLYYRARIERFDKKGPRINALISLNTKALDEARKLDVEAKNRPHKSKLYGIPFIAKDNYNTAGIATSGGSAALKRSVPATNAFVVQKLLEQGAILIGKSNMSELAASYGRLGYSSAGGLTVNPYNAARDVSGSSSGSAAAVAADFAAFALGTDTGGSVRGPANVAGLVGLRPTLGLTSRSGVIPLSLTFDTTGVLTRTVEDLAIVLDAIAGADPQDAATLQQPNILNNYLDALGGQPLKGAHLGVITNFRGGNAEVDGVEQNALKELAAQGAVLVPVTLPKEFENLWKLVLGPVGEAEFKPQFERYLQTLTAAQPRTLAQLIEISSSRRVLDSATPVNPERLKGLREAEATQLTDSPTYIHILTQAIPSIRGVLQGLMAANNLQAFVFSTMSCAATPRFGRADPTYVCNDEDTYRAGYVASAAGFPEVTVPAGRISANMPVGFSFMGSPYSERQLLALARAFEAAGAPLPPPELR